MTGSISTTNFANNANASAANRPSSGNVNGSSAAPAPSGDTVDLGSKPPANPPTNPDDYLKWFTKGNTVTPLFDKSVNGGDPKSEIFANIKEGIQNATKSIQVEMFGFGQPEIADALIAKAKSGVPVQVVLDPKVDGFEQDKGPLIDKMKAGGVDVRTYPTAQADEHHKFAQIDHVKMLLLDGKEGIIGGMNWDAHSPENHDVDVKVQGPIVDKMEALFRKDYGKAGGNVVELPKFDANPEQAGGALVSLATASEEEHDRGIRATLFRAIDTAKTSINAELFCLTDWGMQSALENAKGRGVDVKVLINPLDIQGSKINEKAVTNMRAKGIDVSWFVPDQTTKSKLHAKMAIFDNKETVLGSANWSGNGLTWNHEADMDVIDDKTASAYTSMFQDDWKAGSAEPQYVPEPGDVNA